jgi:hypothetical protein
MYFRAGKANDVCDVVSPGTESEPRTRPRASARTRVMYSTCTEPELGGDGDAGTSTKAMRSRPRVLELVVSGTMGVGGIGDS